MSRRNALQRELDLAELPGLLAREYTQREIAKMFGVSQPSVRADIEEVKRRARSAERSICGNFNRGS